MFLFWMGILNTLFHLSQKNKLLLLLLLLFLYSFYFYFFVLVVRVVYRSSVCFLMDGEQRQRSALQQ